MSIFVTGSTGFLGSYVTHILLQESKERLALLVRAQDEAQAREKLWRGLQLHTSPQSFHDYLSRIDFVFGDLHQPQLGIDDKSYKKLIKTATSVLHIAASLNRKSAKACLNTNLRGSLSVIKLAKAISETNGLKRYSHVSTVAVAGKRNSEVVYEDQAIQWDRSDYDPYARTKKFCEHMARELLVDVPLTFFRPSIVMGDSRFPETSQFDMVRAFCLLADLPLIPLRSDVRLDIVNADWVGHAVATLHMKDKTKHDCYHLSSGANSRTIGEVARAVSAARGKKPRFAPVLVKPFEQMVNSVAGLKYRNPAILAASLLKVFLPYITYDTVFDNTRAVSELGVEPTPFTQYCAGLYHFAKNMDFDYPYEPLPAAVKRVKAA
jgi:thioester reductase-like protein